MSKTKRFDEKKIEKKYGDFIVLGTLCKDDTPEWKRTRDKKRNKPSSTYKKRAESRRRAKRNQDIKNLRAGNIAPEDVNKPKEPRENDWTWN